ncbi:MAG: branched-chain amino acid transaminase [Burkholderiales bacterium]|nr:branched-chain amino acid transaminase [Burkholderiales bacterium]
MTGYKYAFFNNKIDNIENAKISIMTNALQYGTGVFGGIRGYYNSEKNFISIFRLKEHYTRLLASIKILGCDFDYSVDQLCEITIELIRQNQIKKNTYCRPFAYLSTHKLGPNLAHEKLAFCMYMIPLEDYLPTDKGLNLQVSSWRRVSDNAIPSRGKFSGAYLNSAFARKEAADNGYDEAIFLNEAGNVCEGSAENIFIVRNNTLITPDVTSNILEGITRNTLIQIAKENNINVIERAVDRSELYVADEVFLSGTGCQLAWIKSIDKRLIGNGEIGKISEFLRAKYLNIVKGNDAQYTDACTIVEMN